MSWVLLTVAGLLEVGWASMLPATDGLTRPVPTALLVALLAASMIALAIATPDHSSRHRLRRVGRYRPRAELDG